MRWIKTGAALLALFSIIAQETEAQQRGGRGRDGIRGQGVEQILRARESLKLTQDQIAQLDALRTEALERRTAETAAQMEWRSRISAGDATPEEMREALAPEREAARTRVDDHRTRVDAILTEEQRGQLPALRMRATAGRRGFQGRNRQNGRGFRPQQGSRDRGSSWSRGGRRGGPGQPGVRRGPRRPPDLDSIVK